MEVRILCPQPRIQAFGQPLQETRKWAGNAGFRPFDFVSRLPNRQSQSANRRKSPATPANIPVLERLSAENEFDHDCRLQAAVRFAVVSCLGRAVQQNFESHPSEWLFRLKGIATGRIHFLEWPSYDHRQQGPLNVGNPL